MRRCFPSPNCSGVAGTVHEAGRRRGLRVLKVNLGCGVNAAPEWVNVDRSAGPLLSQHPALKRTLYKIGLLSKAQFETAWPRTIIRVDVTRHFPWKPQTVDVIYSSHMLEHLRREEAVRLLQNCRMALKQEAILRLAIPDLDSAVEHYCALKNVGDREAADTFMRSLYVVPETTGGGALHRMAMTFYHRPHQWMYDYESMAEVLESIGFCEVRRHEFGKGDCPDLDLVETRPDSLFVEARRP